MDDYDSIRRHRRKARRPLSATLFDLFYPLFVTLVVIALLSWYMQVPINRVLEESTSHLARKLFF